MKIAAVIIFCVSLFSCLTQAAVAEVSPLPSRLFVEEPTNGNDKFISPNEFDGLLHLRRISMQGNFSPEAVVSVGTFRAFNLFAKLRRDYLLAIDYSPGVTIFNRALAAQILRRTRLQLLGLLIGREILQVPEGISERIYLRQQIENLQMQLALNGSHFDSHSDASSPNGRDAGLDVILQQLGFASKMGSQFSDWLRAIHSYTDSTERYEAFFLGNEASYQFVKAAIADNRFLAMTGSLSGAMTLLSIGRALRSIGAIVSEFDISNALAHVFAFEGSAGLRRFRRNLVALPLIDTSRVLVTADQAAPSANSARAIDGWSYLLLSPRVLASRIWRVFSEKSLAKAYRSSELMPDSRSLLSCELLFDI